MLDLDRVGFDMTAAVIFDRLILSKVDVRIGMGFQPGTSNKLGYIGSVNGNFRPR